VDDMDEWVRVPWTQCHQAISHDVNAKLNASTASASRFLPSESQFAAAMMEEYYDPPHSTTTRCDDDADEQGGEERGAGGLLSTSGVRCAAAALDASWDAWDEIVLRNTNPHTDASASEHPTLSLNPGNERRAHIWGMLRGCIRARLQCDEDYGMDVNSSATEEAASVQKTNHKNMMSMRSLQVVNAAASLEMDLALSTSLATAAILSGDDINSSYSCAGASVAGAVPAWLGTLCSPALVASSKRVLTPAAAAPSGRGIGAFEPAEIAQRSMAASSAWYGSVAPSVVHGSSQLQQHPHMDTLYAPGSVVGGLDGVAPSIVYSSPSDVNPPPRGTGGWNLSDSVNLNSMADAWLTSMEPSGTSARHLMMPTEEEVEEDSALARALLRVAEEGGDPSANFDGHGDAAVVQQTRQAADHRPAIVEVGAHQRLVFRNGQLSLEDRNRPPRVTVKNCAAKHLGAAGGAKKKHKAETDVQDVQQGTAVRTGRVSDPVVAATIATEEGCPGRVGNVAIPDEAVLKRLAQRQQQAREIVQITIQRWGSTCGSLCEILRIGLEGLQEQ
jgi:hypothetical protein